MTRVSEVHEDGCICTSCLTGAAVPLDSANPEQIADLLSGRIENWTEHELPTRAVVTIGGHKFSVPLNRLYPPEAGVR